MARQHWEEIPVAFNWEAFLKETVGWRYRQPLNIGSLVLEKCVLSDPSRVLVTNLWSSTGLM